MSLEQEQEERAVVRNSPRLSLVAVVAFSLGACATVPPPVDRYSVEIPAGVTDARGRFQEIFCAVLADHGAELADYRPCGEALSPVDPVAKVSGVPVPLGQSRRRLVAAVVPGIGYECFAEWLQAPGTAAAHVRQFDYGQVMITVDGLSGIENNARQIRDALMAMPAEPGPARVILIGYSKGIADTLEAVVRYPEIRSRVAAVVSVAGAVRGSALANDAEQEQAELLRHWPGSSCDEGDRRGVESLRPAVREAWLAQNPLPPSMRYYSVVTLPTPERVSRVIEKSYRQLGEIDWRNDSQVIYSDQIIPGSILLGFLNADHWAVAVPVNRSHPAIAGSFADQNDYPREALLEALLRFIEEDLDRATASH